MRMKCFVRRKKSEKNIIESRNNFPTLAAAHLYLQQLFFLAQTLLFFMDGKFLASSSALPTTIEVR